MNIYKFQQLGKLTYVFWYNFGKKYNKNQGDDLMSKKSLKLGKVIADLALKVTTSNANSICIFLVHQPKLPHGAEKLKKN